MSQPVNVSDFQSLGVRPYIFEDEHNAEFVVRLKTKYVDAPLCGCAGRLEAEAVQAIVLSVIAIAAVSFSEGMEIVADGLVTKSVIIENLKQYELMKQRAIQAMEALRRIL